METEEFILAKAAEFVSSEQWWRPIISFMYDNADKFKEQGYNVDQYNVFLKFTDLVSDLVDNKIAKAANTNEKTLEWTLFSCAKSFKINALVTINIFQKAMSFQEFHKQMVVINQSIDYDIAQVLAKFQDQLNQPGVDKDKLAVLFSQVVAKSQNDRINKLISFNCNSTKDLLKVTPKSPKRWRKFERKPQKIPKVIENEPPKIPSELENKIETVLDGNFKPTPPDVANTAAPNRKRDKSKNPEMEAEIEKRREFYRQQRDKMLHVSAPPTYEKSNLPKLIRVGRYNKIV